jgi:AP2 domain/HNH endonuclease
MKQVPLTKGKFALVDDEDYERIMLHKWHAYRNNNGNYYARRAVGYGRWQSLANFILRIPIGVPIDHIDRDTLNNAKSNLRRTTQSANRHNSGKQSGTTAPYKGVSWDSSAHKWRAYIVQNYKQHYLGSFKSAKEAARAYDRKAIELYGDAASLNFTEEL